MQTMGNEDKKTHCSHKELQCKQWVMKEDSLFSQGVTMQTIGKWVIRDDSLFSQGVTMQTMDNEGRVIVHTRSYNANNW
ncbi:hypothetical protein KSS87_019128 [Heliosperma pusillum]|nr:hypothetical protein KSS87_019128 [Heliosperma pusillum]